MLVMYDPELRNEETPWPDLRRMLRELIQPQWSVIEPQSRIRWLRPKTRERRSQVETERIAAGAGLQARQGLWWNVTSPGPSAPRDGSKQNLSTRQGSSHRTIDALPKPRWYQVYEGRSVLMASSLQRIQGRQFCHRAQV